MIKEEFEMSEETNEDIIQPSSVECPWCEREQKIYVQEQTVGRTSHKCESCGISFAIWHLIEERYNK